MCYMGTHLLPPKKGEQQPPTFRPMYCGQTAGWIKMLLGMEVDLGPRHIVLDGDQLSPQKQAQPPIFGPCLLWPNGWIDQDATTLGNISKLICPPLLHKLISQSLSHRTGIDSMQFSKTKYQNSDIYFY